MESAPVDWAGAELVLRHGGGTRVLRRVRERRKEDDRREGKGQAGLEEERAQAGGAGVGVSEDGESAA